MYRTQTIQIAVGAIFLAACGGSPEDYDPLEYSFVSQQAELQANTALAANQPGPQPGPVGPCDNLVAYVPFKLGANATSASYQRPDNCPGWSGLEAHFHTSSALPRRKLWTAIQFDYSGYRNPEAKCLASKLEYETYTQVNVGGSKIWLPVAKELITPLWSGSYCYQHNYNGSTAAPPGEYIERIRARGIRFDGQVVNASVNARLQFESIP